MLRRREFMKALVAAALAPGALAQTVMPTQTRTGPPAPGPVPWMQGLDHAKLETVATLSPEEVAQADAVFFQPQEMATLSRLCDLLMPPSGRQPGAKAAGVPSFLDFFVSESSGEVQQFYREGLGWMEGESRRMHRRSFAEADHAQADAILRPLLRTWMPDHYPDGVYERFLNAVHHDVRMATVNSQAWASAVDEDAQATRRDLYWLPVEPDLQRKPGAMPSTKR